MSHFILKLSVLTFLMIFSSVVKADSFSLSVNSTTCTMIENKSKRDVRFDTYDKAALIAVKTSKYLKEKVGEIKDYDYTKIAYKIADQALKDIVILTTIDDDEKICIEFKGNLEENKVDTIIKQYKNENISSEEIKKIVDEINLTLPRNIDDAEKASILVYIEDLEYHNHTTTKNYTKEIETKLSFRPDVLVTTNRELADYFIVPRILKSSIDVISDTNSKFSMSIEVELKNNQNVSVTKAIKNRYVIIQNTEDNQSLAQKMLLKLLNEALNELTDKMDLLHKKR